jgi:acid phosphatase family membrane protein YuiD
VTPARIVEQLARFATHPVFLSAFTSWLTAQVLKSVVALFRNRPRTARETLLNIFWATGGMPSSHSAVVSAIATSIGFVQGVDAPLFILALFYALLIVRDALGVRRAAGSQARTLNQLIRELGRRTRLGVKPVREIHGHTPSEVFVGMLLGFFIAVAFCSL